MPEFASIFTICNAVYVAYYATQFADNITECAARKEEQLAKAMKTFIYDVQYEKSEARGFAARIAQTDSQTQHATTEINMVVVDRLQEVYLTEVQKITEEYDDSMRKIKRRYIYIFAIPTLFLASLYWA